MTEPIIIRAGEKYLAEVLVTVQMMPLEDLPAAEVDTQAAACIRAQCLMLTTTPSGKYVSVQYKSAEPVNYPDYSVAELKQLAATDHAKAIEVLERLHPSALLLFVKDGLDSGWLKDETFNRLINLLGDRLHEENKRKFSLEG